MQPNTPKSTSNKFLYTLGILSFLVIGSFFMLSSVVPTFDSLFQSLNQNTPSSAASGVFTETFDGAPTAPQPFTQTGQNIWDIAIHSRNPDTWDKLVPFKLHHGPNCEPPLITSAIAPFGTNELMTHDWDGTYENAVFRCADHIMTGIFGVGRSINDSYGLVVLTPNQMVDFTDGPATIKWNMTTYRTTQRDWIDVWITPYDENLDLPFDSSSLGVVDLQGAPRNAVEISMTAPNDNSKTGFRPQIFKNGANTNEFKNFSNDYNWFTGYEDLLPGKAGDPKRRDTFEITISKNHIKICMPQDTADNAPSQTLCWADKDIGTLPFTKGVVQFAHHSYTPNKDCSFYSPLICGPDTWHWDNIVISPSAPFKMIKGDRRMVTNDSTPVNFAEPAPANAKLRFSAAGNVQLSFNGGSYQSVSKQASTDNHPDHVASFFVPVPQGTTSVRVKLTEAGTGSVHAKDFAIWSQTGATGTTPNPPTATAAPVATNTPTPTQANNVTPTATVRPTSTPTRTPTPTNGATSPTPTSPGGLTPTPSTLPPMGGPGDINGDKTVDIRDLGILVGFYARATSSAPENELLQRSDLNRSGVIDIFDLGIIASNYGKKY